MDLFNRVSHSHKEDEDKTVAAAAAALEDPGKSLYHNRAKFMSDPTSRSGLSASAIRRRNSFNSTVDIGKDHTMTKKERFIDKLKIPVPQMHFPKKKTKEEEEEEEEDFQFGQEDEESMRYFNLRHLFTREDSDPYSSTYKRNDSTTDAGKANQAWNMMVLGTAVQFNR